MARACAKEWSARRSSRSSRPRTVGQGTGLGLSQVYGFLKQSGGHAKIYSEEGEGHHGQDVFPAAEGRAPRARRFGERTSVPALRSTHAETILVVEDDEDVRAMTCGNLRELGYTVIEAADGPAALRLLETDPTIRLCCSPMSDCPD